MNFAQHISWDVRFDFAQHERLWDMALRKCEAHPPYIAIASRRNAAPLSVRL
ncbi:hypothetical protein GGQ89_000312 [Sphingomonas yabuuchiae]|uniref:Uncharacterized protein n=1 Tax=Sphingomonas yabuuchiae TaxID=172044 RepID=A0ABR6K4Z7_9SPHN|nr:hypothetical protein [Sphingomonas yabuuchiae]